MDPELTKGVVVGCTGDQSTYFICSKNTGETVLYYSDRVRVKIGDCVEFESIPFYSEKNRCKGKAAGVRVVPSFLNFELERNGTSCLLILDIIDSGERYSQIDGRVVPFVRTNFLDIVWDSGTTRYTTNCSKSELKTMRAVCKRIIKNDGMNAYWAVINIRLKSNGNNEMISRKLVENFDEKLELNSTAMHTKTSRNDRILTKGFICTKGEVRNGKDELYIWVLNKPRDVYFPERYRRGRDRREFYGRWVSFKLNSNNAIDEYSDVEIINDCFPTRKYKNFWEIRLPCHFDSEKWNGRKNPELFSEDCGWIIDSNWVLEKYERLSSFSDNAWVRTMYCIESKNTRIMLSEQQDEWKKEEKRFVDNRERASRCEESTSFKKSEFDRHDDRSSISSGNRNDALRGQTKQDGPVRNNYEEKPKEDKFSIEFETKHPRDPPPRRSHEEDDFDDSSSESSDGFKSDARSNGNEQKKPQTKLEKLKFKYNYMAKEGLAIPDKLVEELNFEMSKELEGSRKPHTRDDDAKSDVSSGMRKRKDTATTKVLKEKLEKCERVMRMVREMLQSQEVCVSMRKFDTHLTEQLFDAIEEF